MGSRWMRNTFIYLLIVVAVVAIVWSFLGGKPGRAASRNRHQLGSRRGPGTAVSKTIGVSGDNLTIHAKERRNTIYKSRKESGARHLRRPPQRRRQHDQHSERRDQALIRASKLSSMASVPDQPDAVHHPRRDTDLHLAAGAGLQLPGDELRQEPRPHVQRQQADGHVRGRGRRGRGEAGAAGGRRVPEGSGEVRLSGRAHPARRAAGRAARHRQDAAGQGRRRRGGRAVLLDQRLGVRRDVRRRRRLARARPVRPGEAQRALHRLRRRDRRGGPAARRRPGRQPRRARADAEPDPGGDGRVRHEHERHRPGGDEPAGHPGPGAAASRPVRPAGGPGPAGHQGPQGDPGGARARASRWTRTCN